MLYTKSFLLVVVIAAALLFSLQSSAQLPDATLKHLTINSAAHPVGTKLKLYREWPFRTLIDTGVLDDSGQVQLSIAEPLPAVFTLELRKPYLSKTFILEKGASKIDVTAHLAVSFDAGPLQVRLENFLDEIKPLEQEWSKVGANYQKASSLEDKLIAEAESRDLAEKVHSRKADFIKVNANTILGHWYAHYNINILDLKQLEMLKDCFYPSRNSNKISEEIEAKIRGFKANLLTGTKAPSFLLPSIEGDSISLEMLLKKNKYVLIDFWASWCTPCRAVNRSITPHYAALKSKGIAVVSISVDEDEGAWKKAVLSDQIPWIQLVSKSMKSKAVLDFKVKSLPSTFLVDQSGTIIKQNIEVYELLKML
ncbi:TlpA family protein disulfide reductase [Pedobacter sp. MC2016-14]|uniref:TlpA family protein disulfide reductase n=1 Tax=Pedobacter sp. MC2016-14 TaxID=2897327 RepID=UPI001E4F3D71|nr:TlpA disulfide reductase family protein [Pedobacter sp. MC2016-14]MCD0488067.1 TlpA family protein disulfide reductase [Pedobacter sp. MC2016-14]